MKTYEHITAAIICDSHVSTLDPQQPGARLTTFEITYPRYIHAEVMTHRIFSRNAQSSRAIPVEKRLKRVRENPVVPIRWGANQKGMQASMDDVKEPGMCEYVWNQAAKNAEQSACNLLGENLHKQWVNRLLEPFDTITTILTGTYWNNFFALRCHKDAQPEFQWLAWKMADLYFTGDLPKPLKPGQLHVPYLKPDESSDDVTDLKRSVARCARVSYLNHDQTVPDTAKDCALHDRLLVDGHMSPFEHQAWAGDSDDAKLGGNFGPSWRQYRKTIPSEVRTFDYDAALKDRPY